MNKEMRLGVILNYSFLVIVNIANLILMPAMMHGMGKEIYGVYVIALTMMTFFFVNDYGIGTSFISQLVSLRTAGNKRRMKEYMCQMFVVYAVMAALVSLLCLVIAFVYPRIFQQSWTNEQREMLRNVLIIMVINCFLMFFKNYIFSIITSFDKLVFTRICNITAAVFRAGVLISLFYAGHLSIYFAALIDTIITLVYVIIYILYAVKLGTAFGLGKFDFPLIKSNAFSMLMLYALQIGNNFFWGICSTMIALYLPTSMVAYFSIALTFCQIYIQLSATIAFIRLAQLTEIEDAGDKKKTMAYLLETGSIQAVFYGVALVGFVVFGNFFLKFWLGDDFTVSYQLGLFMMSALFFPCCQSMLEVYLYVKKKFFVRTVVIAVMALCNVGLMAIFIPKLGLIGAGVAVAISYIIFNFIIMSVIYQSTGIKTWSYNVQVIGRLVPSVLLAIGAGLAVIFFAGGGIISVLAATLLAMAIYAATAYVTYLTGDQRYWIKQLLHISK